MANERGKSIDKTYLSIDQAEGRGFIHRDYIAHCLRWTHVCKCLMERHLYKTARVLDVGCGRELPMAKMLYSSRLIPLMYFGVDAGPIEDEACAKVAAGKFPHTLWEKTNFLELTKEDVWTAHDAEQHSNLPNIVTCFEVLEHVEPKMMIDMLEHMKRITSDDCRFFISTPCWNRTDCAANHVNEMLYESLGSCFERHGFIIEAVHGTFASIRDYEHLLGITPPRADARFSHLVTRQLFDALRVYYDTNFLSCVFAPLFSAQSRNCLWELRKNPNHIPGVIRDRKFPLIGAINRPWSSSAQWQDMEL